MFHIIGIALTAVVIFYAVMGIITFFEAYDEATLANSRTRAVARPRSWARVVLTKILKLAGWAVVLFLLLLIFIWATDSPPH